MTVNRRAAYTIITRFRRDNIINLARTGRAATTLTAEHVNGVFRDSRVKYRKPDDLNNFGGRRRGLHPVRASRKLWQLRVRGEVSSFAARRKVKMIPWGVRNRIRRRRRDKRKKVEPVGVASGDGTNIHDETRSECLVVLQFFLFRSTFKWIVSEFSEFYGRHAVVRVSQYTRRYTPSRTRILK